MKDRYFWLIVAGGMVVFIALVSWASITIYRFYHPVPVAVSPATAPNGIQVASTSVSTTTPQGTIKVRKPREGKVEIDLSPYLLAIAERDDKITSLEAVVAHLQGQGVNEPSGGPDNAGPGTDIDALAPVVHVQRAGWQFRPGVLGAWDMAPGREPVAEFYGYLQLAFAGDYTFGLHVGQHRAGANMGRYLPWCENLQAGVAISHQYRAPAFRHLSGGPCLKVKF